MACWPHGFVGVNRALCTVLMGGLLGVFCEAMRGVTCCQRTACWASVTCCCIKQSGAHIHLSVQCAETLCSACTAAACCSNVQTPCAVLVYASRRLCRLHDLCTVAYVFVTKRVMEQAHHAYQAVVRLQSTAAGKQAYSLLRISHPLSIRTSRVARTWL